MRTDAPATGFMGVPVETDLARVTGGAAVLGVPHGYPYSRPGSTAGCVAAPAAVRERSQRLGRFRGHWDFDLGAPLELGHLVDAGDVPGAPNDGPGNAERATAAVAALLDAGTIPLCIGGDDSVPIPIIRAYADRGPLTVVQVDAHLDFRDEIDGVREGYSSPMRRASEMAHVERIVQVGLRGVGSARPEDVDDARAAGNVLVSAREVHEAGVGTVLHHLPDDARVFVSFDCDGLDPSVAPAVSAVAPGGLTYQQAWELLNGIGPRMVGAAFTELVPALDGDGRSALAVVRLLCACAATLRA